MSFEKIIESTSCDCFSEANENTSDVFVRKVRKSPDLKDADFRNSIERGKLPKDEKDCIEVCGFNGVSFEIWNDKSSEKLMSKYLYTSEIAPKHSKHLCKVKFLPASGKVKHTPDQQEFNEFHYDFYKDDSFSVAMLQIVEMIPVP